MTDFLDHKVPYHINTCGKKNKNKKKPPTKKTQKNCGLANKGHL